VRLPAARLVLGLLAFVLVGWAVGAVWTSVVGSGELEAMRNIADQRSAGLTAVARAVTWAGSAFVLVPLAVVCCLVLVRAGLRREACAVALSLAGAMLISDVVKLLVSRPRPPVEHLQSVTGSSFPSGHATQASAFWFSLVLALRATRATPMLLRAAGALALALVVAVALSRVYLGVHYPADVIAGVLLGTGWAVFVARCLRRGEQADGGP
jgi:undecaprenyl-diphosphatase